jgi:hypothetical protein
MGDVLEAMDKIDAMKKAALADQRSHLDKVVEQLRVDHARRWANEERAWADWALKQMRDLGASYEQIALALKSRGYHVQVETLWMRMSRMKD